MCIALKYALPPFSPPLPSGVQTSKQNMHRIELGDSIYLLNHENGDFQSIRDSVNQIGVAKKGRICLMMTQ